MMKVERKQVGGILDREQVEGVPGVGGQREGGDDETQDPRPIFQAV